MYIYIYRERERTKDTTNEDRGRGAAPTALAGEVPDDRPGADDFIPVSDIRPFSYLRFAYLRLQSLDFEQTNSNITFKASGDHIVIKDPSRLSI